MSSKIKVMDFLKEVDYNRKKLIDHAKNNGINVSDNISLSSATNLAMQFGRDDAVDNIPEFIPEPDPAREGPFDIIWIDLDGTELFKEVVNKGEAATQFTGEPNLHKQFPDIISWDGWEYNGSLESTYRDVIVVPKYTIKPDEEGKTWNHIVINVDIDKLATYTIQLSSGYSSYGFVYSTGYINWGDGTDTEATTANPTTFTHTYTKSGTYIISMRSTATDSNYSKVNINFSGYPYIFTTRDMQATIEYAFADHFSGSAYSGLAGPSQFNYAYNLKALVINNTADMSIYYTCIECFNLKVYYGYCNMGISEYSLDNTQGYYWTSLKYLIGTSKTQYFTMPILTHCIEHVSIPENTIRAWISGGSLQWYHNDSKSISEDKYPYYNTKLTKLYIPDGITNCRVVSTGLEYITIPSSVTTLSLNQNIKLKHVYFENLDNVKFEVSCFANCESLRGIEIPSTMTSIPNYCFNNCYNLRRVDGGDNISSIGQYAFSKTPIQTFNTSHVTEISSSAFKECEDLLELDLSSCISIGSSAFEKCKRLKRIYNSSLVETIGQAAFRYCYSLKSIDLSSVNTFNSSGQFVSCWSLESVSFGSNIQSIPNDTFIQCYALKEIDLSSTKITTLSSNFTFCWNCEKVSFPNSLTTVSSCFTEMYGIKSIEIPETLLNITASFTYCTNLLNLHVKSPISMPNSFTYIYIAETATFEQPITLNGWSAYSNMTELNLPDNSNISSSIIGYMVNIQEADFSRCNVTNTLYFYNNFALRKLLLPQDYNYALDISQTQIFDNLEYIVNCLIDLTGLSAKTLTISPQQKDFLTYKGWLENITNKNWTVATKNRIAYKK